MGKLIFLEIPWEINEDLSAIQRGQSNEFDLMARDLVLT